MSIPVQPENKTKPPIVDAYRFAVAYLACASSSVLPSIGVNVAKNLIDRGSRPFFCAISRMAAICGLRMAGLCDETKTASACVAANAGPALIASVSDFC